MAETASHSAATKADNRPLIERRASVRYYPKDVQGQVAPKKGGRPYKAMVHDLSTTGIAMVLHHSFDRDTLLSVELQSADQSFSFSLLAEVVHCTPTDNHNWRIGCRFVRELTEEEVRNMV
ncbi:MAG: PilZ domain-containing protein [Gemmataceae bacterium]